MSLFGDDPALPAKPAKKPRAKPPEADTVVLRLEAAFAAAHEARWRVAPFVGSIPRARKHFKDLAAQLGEPEVLRLIDVYFSTADPKVTSRDYTVECFYGLVAHLRLLEQRHAPDARTAANLDAINRGMARKKERP